jgi:hypothetical protein
MPLPSVLTHNLGWKAASVVLATLVWLMVSAGAPTRLGPSAQRLFTRQSITIMTAADDPFLYRVDPGTVAIRIAGPRDLVNQLHPQDIQAFVDLTTITETSELHKRVQVFVSPELTVLSVSPREVTIHAFEAPPTAEVPSRP